MSTSPFKQLLNYVLRVHRNRRLIRDGSPALELCSQRLKLKCCFTFTETVGLLGTGDQDVHLDFHTAPELSESHC